MKTTIKHIILWACAIALCIACGCKKTEHPINLDWSKGYKPKQLDKQDPPIPWHITAYYYPPDPTKQNRYWLVAKDGRKVSCIDRDLEEWMP